MVSKRLTTQAGPQGRVVGRGAQGRFKHMGATAGLGQNSPGHPRGAGFADGHTWGPDDVQAPTSGACPWTGPSSSPYAVVSGRCSVCDMGSFAGASRDTWASGQAPKGPACSVLSGTAGRAGRGAPANTLQTEVASLHGARHQDGDCTSQQGS